FSGLSTMVDAAVHHQITGVGLRTLEVVGILVIVVALVRTAQLPFHLWFADVVQAPAAVAALVCTTAGISGAFLVARELPLLQAATHVLSALGLVGAASAVVLAAIALFTRDIYRAGGLIAAALLGVSLAAFGAGGFSAGLFALAAAAITSALYFVAAGNLVRGYRTRVISEMGGAWSRMRTSSLALGAWAAAAGGLSLGGYYALSAVLDNHFVNGGHLSGFARGLLMVLLIAAGVAVAVSCWTIVFRVVRGEPARRRGFQPERLADARDASRVIAVALVVALVVLVLFALPGLGRVSAGKTGTIAFTWQQLLVLGRRPQAGLSLAALGISMVMLLLGTGVALLLRPVLQRRSVAEREPAPAVAVAAVHRAERVYRGAGTPVLLAARFVARFDERVGDALVDTVGEGIGVVGEAAQSVRRWPARTYTAGAAAAVVLLVVLSLLAASGHLGGVRL
ncbi:MAG TPA: proton-conducting transporter membrane subunit, partial [Candidatus Dormibacteraeota bacterium]|nr:proton-conducting transporter membrane subunit [Candidatus Dormibacteraeota bacterium]